MVKFHSFFLGIFALVLEANRRLTWRDLQHLVVRTSVMVSPDDTSWQKNGAGHDVNIKFGFGALSAARLVSAARDPSWRTASMQHICKADVMQVNENLKKGGSVVSKVKTNGCAGKTNTCVTKLEHVHVVVNIEKKKQRGQLEIFLTSPSGTRSDILRKRVLDTGNEDGFQHWAFLTVFHWDEDPSGQWTLEVKDNSQGTGKLNHWSLIFYGTCDTKTLGISVNETEICDKKCKQNCPTSFSNDCVGCAQYCDCTVGKCVADCGDYLVTDSEHRHCRRSSDDINYNNIPNSGASNAGKPLTKMSISATFAVICLTLVIISVLIGGIAYFAAKMPSKHEAKSKGYHSVSRYPYSDVGAEEDCALEATEEGASKGLKVSS